MGRIVVTEFITLDGVIEEPRWSFEFNRGEEGDKFKGDELRAADAQLLGRVTYQGFAKAWPSMADDWFGEKMNSMPKYVVSTTLTDDDADWTNSTVIRSDVAGQISRVKEQVAGDILVAGSAQLVRTLAEHDLVDEYRLMVFPIVLGTGKRLFGDGAPRIVLRLVDSTPVGPDGVFILTYQPAVEDRSSGTPISSRPAPPE
jgi:dihydrofolate reductase